MTHQHEKKESMWSGVIKDILFDKAVWLFAALCIMGYSYWQKVSTSHFSVPFEFSINQMTRDTARDTKVNQILLDLLHDAHADRAIIMQFHNGEKLAGGNPFRKMSCSYEAAQLGVSRELHNLQNIPLSSVPECLKELVDHEKAFVIVVDKLPCGPTRALLEEQGIRITVRKRLTVGQDILGFIAVNFVNNGYLTEDSTNYDARLQSVLDKVDNAGGFLQLEFEKESGH